MSAADYTPFSMRFGLLGGELPLPPEAENGPVEPELLSDSSQMMHLFFTGFDLPLFARELERLHDGLPLPQLFEWEPPVMASLPSQLKAEQARCLIAFQQILERQQKSSRYLAQIKAVLAACPEQELALMISQYLRLWHPAEHLAFMRQQLAQNPGWRVLRYLLGAYWLMDSDDTQSTAFQTTFFELMEGLELDPVAGPFQAWEVLAFYQTQASWYLFGAFHPERALYALNVCFAVLRDVPESLSEAHEAESLLRVWMARIHEQPETAARIRVLIRPLQQARLAATRQA
jgi:hypothetical protein